MNKKNIIGAVFAILIFTICIGCLSYDYNREDKIKEIVLSPNKKYYLMIIEQESMMAFGSGWYELRLYSSYKLLGKCTFGKFPFEIKNWDIENNEIIIKINDNSERNSSYINQWISKNTHIGKFKISYQFL